MHCHQDVVRLNVGPLSLHTLVGIDNGRAQLSRIANGKGQIQHADVRPAERAMSPMTTPKTTAAAHTRALDTAGHRPPEFPGNYYTASSPLSFELIRTASSTGET